MMINPNELRLLKEKIEILVGERGDSDKAALRRSYLKILQQNLSLLQESIALLQQGQTTANGEIDALQTGLATANSNMTTLVNDVTAVSIPSATAATISAAPTAAQYNALLNDVNDLRTALSNLKTAII